MATRMTTNVTMPLRIYSNGRNRPQASAALALPRLNALAHTTLMRLECPNSLTEGMLLAQRSRVLNLLTRSHEGNAEVELNQDDEKLTMDETAAPKEATAIENNIREYGGQLVWNEPQSILSGDFTDSSKASKAATTGKAATQSFTPVIIDGQFVFTQPKMQPTTAKTSTPTSGATPSTPATLPSRAPYVIIDGQPVWTQPGATTTAKSTDSSKASKAATTGKAATQSFTPVIIDGQFVFTQPKMQPTTAKTKIQSSYLVIIDGQFASPNPKMHNTNVSPAKAITPTSLPTLPSRAPYIIIDGQLTWAQP